VDAIDKGKTPLANQFTKWKLPADSQRLVLRRQTATAVFLIWTTLYYFSLATSPGEIVK
jgi:hypothetical protein